MIDKIKDALDNLNSALFILQDKIVKIDTQKKKLDGIEKKREDEISVLAAKTKELNIREGEIKEIESIVEFSKQAKNLMAQARTLKKNAEDQQEGLTEGLKKLVEDHKKLDTELQNNDILQKKQADAIRFERAELDEQKKEFAIRKKVTQEMGK